MPQHTPHSILKTYFGYDQFRPLQEDIITACLSQRDIIALLPTGGGKSLCFQVPGMVMNGTTLVISPLISLMKDQVDTLNRKGIPATYINSSLPSSDIKDRLQKLADGYYKFVYLAPERLLNQTFLQACQNVKISLLAIDESHCLSQWGYDFRPAYFEIATQLAKLQQRPPIMALTATATSQVLKDIQNYLQLQEPTIFRKSFARSNLKITTKICDSRSWQLFFMVYLLKKHHDQSGIIYALTRKSCEELLHVVQRFLPDISIAVYHGGLPNQLKSLIQESFLNNDIDVVIATNAFGMGVDKPNVRFVIHYHLPGSIEAYYQEIGRGGRDGEESWCYLLHYPPDLQLHYQLLSLSSHQKHRLKLYEHQLDSMIALATQRKCRTNQVLTYFNEKSTSKHCGVCDACDHSLFQPTKQEINFYQNLKRYRDVNAHALKKPPAEVCSSQLLHWLALLQPKSLSEISNLPGAGNGWISYYFNTFKVFLDSHSIALS